MLTTVYHDYHWLPWKFEKTPKNYFSEISNQRIFLDWAGKELGIKEMSDWYNINIKVTEEFLVT
jgi:hypothetical protein